MPETLILKSFNQSLPCESMLLLRNFSSMEMKLLVSTSSPRLQVVITETADTNKSFCIRPHNQLWYG